MSATITDEQFAARELVRSWASSAAAIEAARAVEHGEADAWRAAYQGVAELGIFGVALPEQHGGAGGTADDLCAMVDEAAAAMVPGPIATTALATLVVNESHAELLEALASGERTAGVALSADLRYGDGRVSGTAEYVLGADPHGVLLLPAGDKWLLVDATADGVTIEPQKATDFSRPLARVQVDSAPADVLTVAGAARRGPRRDCAGRRGRRTGPLDPADRHRVREGARAVRQADRQLPGHQAHVRRDAAALRADFGGRRGRRQCGGESR